MLKTARAHWPNYLIEGIGLSIMMIVMGCMATLLYAPTSPVSTWLGNDFWRSLLLGLSIGGSVTGIIYSPWGKRSGAHLNPAVTLTYWRLNKLAAIDALAYILAQCIGAALGIGVVAVAVGQPFTQELQAFASTPQYWGWLGASIAELLGAFVWMMTILLVSNTRTLTTATGSLLGSLMLILLVFLLPISGFGLNPARSLASGLSAHIWDSFWIYYLVPSLAMLAAAEIYLQHSNTNLRTICCKLCPNQEQPCVSIDCCQKHRNFAERTHVGSHKTH